MKNGEGLSSCESCESCEHKVDAGVQPQNNALDHLFKRSGAVLDPKLLVLTSKKLAFAYILESKPLLPYVYLMSTVE